MDNQEAKIKYLLHLADDAVILGQRLGEWCGHGPVLEQDMAMTNIALDYIGRARLLYQYAATLSGGEATEDRLAFFRSEWDYLNHLMVELDNGDFANTVARQFFIEAFQFPYYQALANSRDSHLAEIAAKTVKETAYHLKWSAEWVIRLGDGTELSHQKMQNAVQELWPFTGEWFVPTEYEKQMTALGVAPDLSAIQTAWTQKVDAVLEEATLQKPEPCWMQGGGKSGRHTEHMGYLLTELQYMQRAYPGLEW